MYSSFQENRFRRQVDKALENVKNILDLTRNPRYAEEEDHTYENKYDLANLQINTSIAAQINIVQKLGLDETKFRRLCDYVHKDKKNITMRFVANDECTFVKEQDVDVITHESEVQIEETKTKSGVFGTSTKSKNYKTKVKTKVKEYHWKITAHYKLFIYAGCYDPNNDDNIVELQSVDAPGKSTIIITTGMKRSPIDERTVHQPIEASLTWLIQNISIDQHVCKFKIDRSDDDNCRTPRRNDQIDEAFRFFHSIQKWSKQCKGFFIDKIQRRILDQHNPAQKENGSNTAPGWKQMLDEPSGTYYYVHDDGTTQWERPAAPIQDGITTTKNLTQVKSDNIFVPILPLFEKSSTNNEQSKKDIDNQYEDPKSLLVTCPPASSNDCNGSPLLSVGDIDLFLNEQLRTMDIMIAELSSVFPETNTPNKLVTASEASLVMLFQHNSALTDQLVNCINYIEYMLRAQLVTAIGKEVQPKDFDEFIRFHNQKLLGPEFRPGPFCYAIRRPNHYPDGMLSIESTTKDGKFEPTETIVRKISGDTSPPISLPINAATTVEFTGDRFLHGWIQHQFGASTQNTNKFKLAARARQFSSFILLVGKICGPDKFDPKDAIIVQNKDEVIVPLLLDTLPTAKEFKDAIASLSPEQQRFARSFRDMQLESSVFGVCFIQLKPQLEALLGLPPDSLTKEIGLTQDLLALFIDYQISSDLLSFDGPSDATTNSDKVDAVKGYVKSVQDVINKEKEKQIEEATKEADMREELSHMQIEHNSLARSRQSSRSRGAGFMAGGSGGSSMSRSCAAEKCSFVASVPMAMTAQFSAPLPPSPAPSPPSTYGAFQSSAPTFKSASVVPAKQQQQASPIRETQQQPDIVGNEPEQQVPQQNVQVTTGQLDISSTTESFSAETIDFTSVPKQLDSMFEIHDNDDALRSTIVKAGTTWSRTRQQNLLTKPTKSRLNVDEQKTEKNKAFDLLDALSRSGILSVSCGELHVIVAVTHCFENSLMNSVIQDNINPIEKVEKTTLMIASTIHATTNTKELLKDSAHASRLIESYPALFDGGKEHALMDCDE